MVQILERQPSFGEEFGRALGSGIGSGVQGGLTLAQQLMAQKSKKRERALEKMPGQAQKWLKQFGPSFLMNEKAYNAFRDKAASLIEQGYDPEDAFSLAKESFGKEQLSMLGATPKKGLMDVLNLKGPSLFEQIKEHVGKAGSAIEKRPDILASELPVAGVKSLESAASLLGSLNPQNRLYEQLLNKDKEIPLSISEEFGRYMRKHLPEDVKEGASAVSDIGSFLLDLAIPLPKAIKTTTGKTSAAAAEKIAESVAAKEAGLAGRAGKGLESATEMRMSRMAPESRMYKTGEQAKVLQEQLKLYPKYASEIAADAEKRAARLNRALGPRGMATKEARIATAQKELPEALKSYQTAASRIRALENEMATMSAEAKSKIQPLYEAAKNELRDSEFYAKQIFNNAKTGEARVGLEEMRTAARQKMVDMEQKALAGEKIDLAKADYNPEHIARAKQLAKKKPLPTSRQMDDFYTQVHDEYIKEYAKRIAQLDAEIAKPTANISDAMKKRARVVERDNLKKMVASAEAENTIHRHNMALREINQRKLASDRLRTQTGRTEAPKVSQAAQSGIESEAKIAEGLKTPEGRVQLTEGLIEEASKENPKLSASLEKERGPLTEALDKVRKQEEKITTTTQQPAKTEKQKIELFKKISDDLSELGESFRNGGKTVFQTKIGKDFLRSVASQVVSEALSGLGIDDEYSALTSAGTAAVFGNRGSWGYRAFFGGLIRLGIDKYRKENYKSALRDFDHEKSLKLEKSYSRSIIKEAKEEMKSSF